MSSTNTPARSSWSRGKSGVLLVLLCFTPAAVNAVAPEFWRSLPDAARWTAYGASGVMIAVVVWLILSADYSSHSSMPDETS